MADALSIGDAAAVLGIEPHVLRHWEDVKLLHPPRTSGGHRAYDHELITRARLIRVCQRAGMSLAEIRALATTGTTRRVELVAAKRAEIHAAVARLRTADAFLEHVLTCRHPIVSECEQCSSFATDHTGRGGPRPAPGRVDARQASQRLAQRPLRLV
jgi:MerR family copper efflux transcriptional regulator